MKKVINVILCGGSGTRLWPLSRKALPKQFLKLFNGCSLFQLTLQRNAALCDETLIIANKEHYFLILEQLQEVEGPKKVRFLLEEEGRDTAAAIAFAALLEEDAYLFVTPSDHLIQEQGYKEAFDEAKELVLQNYLVTFGITPKEPSSAYGYIQAEGNDVVRFVEKPPLQQAKQYLQEGGYYYNSGMFFFPAKLYLEELKRYEPEIFEQTQKSFQEALFKEDVVYLRDTQAIPKKSVDYAVMERSSRIKMVPAAFAWSDVGSFEELAKRVGKEPLVEIDAKDNAVFAKKAVVTVGIENTIIVDTPDALLVMQKGAGQKVKEATKQIADDYPQLLAYHREVFRPWGRYEVLQEAPGYKIKRIIVHPKKRLSLQKHFHRSEHWVVVSGTALVQVDKQKRLLRPNESIYIPIGAQHRLENPGTIDLVLIEVQVGEYTGEDDIVRIEDDYARE